jgi:hypothetical protein
MINQGNIILSDKRQLYIIAILSYFAFTIIALYFKYFPTIISKNFTDAILIVFIFLTFSLMFYGINKIQKHNDIYFLLPQALIGTFIITAIPNLRFESPPLQDPYDYIISTINIITNGTLMPVLDWWYPQIDLQLHWPMLPLTGSILQLITAVETIKLLSLLMPFLNIIIFLFIYCLAKLIFNNERIALLSGFIAIFSEPAFLFYQSEYHPQALSIIFFSIFIYLFIKSRITKKATLSFLMIIVIVAFLFSHHFSSLFMGLFMGFYLLSLLILKSILKNKISNPLVVFNEDFSLVAIFAVISLFYHFMIYAGFSQQALELIQGTPYSSLISTGQGGMGELPIYYILTTPFKWVVLLLAAISLILIFPNFDMNQLRCAIIFVGFLIFGFIGNYFVNAPTDRFEAFYILIAAIFAAYTFFNIKSRFPNKVFNFLLLTALFSFIIIAGIIGSQTPSLFLHASGQDKFYFYSNDLSSINRYDSTGAWIRTFSNAHSIYLVEFDTRIAPYFFGKKPRQSAIIYTKNMNINLSSKEKVLYVLNPEIIYNYNFDKKNYIKSTDNFYSDGKIVMGGYGIG